MFSQRNNPYCDLLQNCEAKIHIFFDKSKKTINFTEKFEKTNYYEKDIRIGFGNEQHWLGVGRT